MILNVNLNANNKTFFLVSSKTLIVEVHKSKTHIFSPKKKVQNTYKRCQNSLLAKQMALILTPSIIL